MVKELVMQTREKTILPTNDNESALNEKHHVQKKEIL